MITFNNSSLHAKGSSLCAYLVALAAFQRGFRVSFFNDPNKQRQSFTGQSGISANNFRVSDGNKSHFFLRSRGDLTSKQSDSLSKNKWKSKQAFENAGLDVPKGYFFTENDIKKGKIKFSDFHARSLVVKPVSGSVGKGITVGVNSQRSLDNALKLVGAKKFIIEEEVLGEEFRYYVVADRVVAVTGRDAANVVGDGFSTIRQLVKEKNKIRANNPHLYSRKIKLDRLTENFLLNSNFNLEIIPNKGQKVYLSSSANLSRGGDSTDATMLVSEKSKRAAVASLKALKIPNAGVDIINSSVNGVEKNYVIEVNSQAHIGSHSFPMRGSGQCNNVGNAIIDTYFQNSHQGFCRPDIYFDFSLYKKHLSSGLVPWLDIPKIEPYFFQSIITLSAFNFESLKIKLRSNILSCGAYSKVEIYKSNAARIYFFGSKKSHLKMLRFLMDFECQVDDIVFANFAMILNYVEVFDPNVIIPNLDYSSLDFCSHPFYEKNIYTPGLDVKDLMLKIDEVEL